jgi:hypothetical protein
MENDIVSDFQLSVLNSQDAEAIFGDTTDDIIAAADKNGLLEKLPIIKYFVAANKFVEDFRNRRFLKKIYRFLYQTHKYNKKKIKAFFEEFSNASIENGYELMLEVLERLDNIHKVDVMTNLLKAKLDGQITIDDFIRLTASLRIVPYVDLKRLPDYIKSIGTRYDTYMLYAAGLLYNSAIGSDGVGVNNSNHYQLNDNGLLFVKYGLKQDVSSYVKSNEQLIVVADDEVPEQMQGEYPNIKDMLK